MIHYLVTAAHAYTMGSFLESWGKALQGSIVPVSYESLFEGAALGERNACIFSDLDRLSVEQRAGLEKLHGHLLQTAGEHRVLNDPARSLLRLTLLQTLHERGINRFNAWRPHGAVVPRRFPVFIRREAGTKVDDLRVANDAQAYAAEVGSLEQQGMPAGEAIAIEFCNTADAAGVYRKYGAFVVGDRIVPRHVFFSRRWIVKDAELDEPALLAEERDYLEANPHRDELLALCRIAGIGYGRIDYSLLEGRPQIWEINTNPMLASHLSAAIPARRPAHLAFVSRMTEALEALEAGAARVGVRKMRETDRAAAMAILGAWNLAPRAPDAEVPDPERSSLNLDTSFVATNEGTVIGVASYLLDEARGEPSMAETASLAVDPAWRGRGVGEILQHARLAEMKLRGVRHVRTEADRSEVIDWYVRKFGYRVTGTQRKKHAFGRDDVDRWTVLELDLKQARHAK